MYFGQWSGTTWAGQWWGDQPPDVAPQPVGVGGGGIVTNNGFRRRSKAKSSAYAPSTEIPRRQHGAVIEAEQSGRAVRKLRTEATRTAIMRGPEAQLAAEQQAREVREREQIAIEVAREQLSAANAIRQQTVREIVAAKEAAARRATELREQQMRAEEEEFLAILLAM